MTLNRRMAAWLVVLGLIGIAALTAAAQAPAGAPGDLNASHVTATPALTNVAKLQIQNLILVWQMKQHAAEDAKADLLRFVAPLEKDGYTLDLSTLTYTPKAPSPSGTP